MVPSSLVLHSDSWVWVELFLVDVFPCPKCMGSGSQTPSQVGNSGTELFGSPDFARAISFGSIVQVPLTLRLMVDFKGEVFS